MLQQCIESSLLWLGCEAEQQWGGTIFLQQSSRGVGLFCRSDSSVELQQFCVKPFLGPCQSYTLQILAHIGEKRLSCV